MCAFHCLCAVRPQPRGSAEVPSLIRLSSRLRTQPGHFRAVDLNLSTTSTLNCPPTTVRVRALQRGPLPWSGTPVRREITARPPHHAANPNLISCYRTASTSDELPPQTDIISPAPNQPSPHKDPKRLSHPLQPRSIIFPSRDA